MLFGITFEGKDSTEYRLVFTSDMSSSHFRIGTRVSRDELKDLVEHVKSDCKMFCGNSRTSHCCDNVTKPKKSPRFILFRHMEKKKIETEKKEYTIDMKEVEKKNEATLREMLGSDTQAFAIIQSESIPGSDSLDNFYKKKTDEKPPEKKES